MEQRARFLLTPDSPQGVDEASFPGGSLPSIRRRFLFENLAAQGFSASEISRLLGLQKKRVKQMLRDLRQAQDVAAAWSELCRMDNELRAYNARNASHIMRARRYGVPYEDVDLEAVVYCDRSLCHICGLLVVAEDVEFDHVVPLSRGGGHVRGNVRVSHALCNRRKHDKLLSEL